MSDLTRPRRLATTRWTLILAASDAASPGAAAAWSTLCEHYWYPVYAFIRRAGQSPDNAADLTQSFFTRTFERNLFARADRSRGRFRTFLLASVRNFVANAHAAAIVDKRGGGRPPLSIEAGDADRRYAADVATPATPEEIYEAAWARTTLAEAMVRLEQAHADARSRDRFHRLKPLLTDDAPASQAALARELDITEGALRVALHRLRRQYGECLRAVIGETVADAGQVNDELRHLLAIVGRGRPDVTAGPPPGRSS